MKKLFIFALLGGLLLSLSACGEAEEPVALPTPTTPAANKVSADTKAIAEMLTGITLSDEIVTEVHDAATAALENGIEESYYFTDMLSDEKSKCTSRSSSTLGSEIRSLLTKSRNDNSVDADMLQYGDYQIYWPYSEHWDGVSTPVITFVPEDENQLWNYAYRITDAGVDTLIVDEEYMQVHPVWIVNKAEISYDDLPNFANGEIVKNGVMFCSDRKAPNRRNLIGGGRPTVPDNPPRFGVSIDVYTFYLSYFMCTHQYDSIFAGGSEFVVKLGGVKGYYFKSIDEVTNAGDGICLLRLYRSRSQISDKTPMELEGYVLNSDWGPQEVDAAFLLYEEDGDILNRSFKGSVSLNLGDKSYGFEIDLPYNVDDEIICKQNYTRNFLLSPNNTILASGDCYWKITCSKVTYSLL